MADFTIRQTGEEKTIESGDFVEIQRPGDPDESHHAPLGDAAGKDTGTSAGTVAAGDDSRFGGGALGPLEIVRSSKTSAQTTTSATMQDVTNMGGNITIAAGQHVHLSGMLEVRMSRSNADTFCRLEIRRGTTQLLEFGHGIYIDDSTPNVLRTVVPIDLWDLNPGSGTHSYNMRFRVSTSGSSPEVEIAWGRMNLASYNP